MRKRQNVHYDVVRRNSPMPIEATRKLFDVDAYYRMAEIGIIGPEERVELIDGEILQMSPIGVRHAGCVNIANELFCAAFKGKAVVSVQNPLRLNNYNEPEPDLVLLKRREDRYRGKRVEGGDALLVVEVADTTLKFDRDVKLVRYARQGVPEVWIEDLNAEVLLVYRNPSGDQFLAQLVLRSGDSVSVEAFPETSFAVSELLGV